MPTTTRHRALAGKLMENRGSSIYQAMVAVGYSPATAKNPKQIMQSKGFKELLQEANITEDRIAQTIDEGMKATKLFGKDAIEHPDYAVRHKFMETSLRLLGIANLEPPPPNNVYNTFITQNNLDPASPKAKQLMEVTLDALMEQTKRKKVPNGQQG